MKKRKKAARKPEEEVAVSITAEGVKSAKGISEKERSKIRDDLEYPVEMGIIDESELKGKPVNRSIIEQKEPVLSLSRTEIFNIEYEKTSICRNQNYAVNYALRFAPISRTRSKRNILLTTALLV